LVEFRPTGLRIALFLSMLFMSVGMGMFVLKIGGGVSKMK